MASVVRMPSVLAGATEAAIASWLVTPGDTVAVGNPLAEIETEKAIIEYGAEEAGVVGRIVLAAGEVGEIGVPIAVLVKDGETDADIDAALGQATQAASQTRVFASPIVRKIAREKGIDLAAIAGTGPNGRIVRRDLERLADQRRRTAGEARNARPGGSAAGRRPGIRRRHAHPAHSDPARHRAPPHREQGDDAALLHDHGVRRRRTARVAQADQRDRAGEGLGQRLRHHGGRGGLPGRAGGERHLE